MLLNQTQFEAACGELNPRSAQAALKSSGLLHTHDDQFKAKVSVPELGLNKVRFYWLKLDKLLNDATVDAVPDAEPAPRAVSRHVELDDL